MCRKTEKECNSSTSEESEEGSEYDETDDEDSPNDAFRSLSELNREFEERRAHKFKSLEELTRDFQQRRQGSSRNRTSEVAKTEHKDAVKDSRSEAQTMSSSSSQYCVGSVERVFEGRGFGFITPNDGTNDVFLHCSDIKESSERLHVGAKVRFQVEVDATSGKKRARNATILDSAPKAAAANTCCYGRDQLLDMMHMILASKASRREGDLRIHTVYMPKGEHSAASHLEDPTLDDEKLIAKLEERLDRECGADVMNMETFGTCRGGWSFEEALAANAKLLPNERAASACAHHPEDCPSTASSGGASSEHPSSDTESVNGDWPGPPTYLPDATRKENPCLEHQVAVIFQ